MSELSIRKSNSVLSRTVETRIAAPDPEHMDAVDRVLSAPHAVEPHGVWLDGTFPLYAEGSSLAEELLLGASEVGAYCRKSRRAIFHLVHTSGSFPWCRIGSRICSTRSAIDAWLKGQMLHHTPSGRPLRSELRSGSAKK